MPAPALNARVLRGAVASTVRPWLGPRVPHRVQRLGVDSLARHALPRARVHSATDEVGGVRVLRQRPASAVPGRTIVYFHGGGYVIGSARGHAALTSHLAAAAQATVISADYRLAPEHPFPAALDDAGALLRALLDAGQAPEALSVAGDSAGGGLALAAVLGLRDEGRALPHRVFLISPWLDLRCPSPALGRRRRSDPLLSQAGLERWAADVSARHPREDPRLSPGLAPDLSGLPPMLIQYDAGEVLGPDSERFAARVHALGGPLELQPYSGLWHDFQFFTVLPEARRALALGAAFLIAAS